MQEEIIILQARLKAAEESLLNFNKRLMILEADNNALRTRINAYDKQDAA